MKVRAEMPQRRETRGKSRRRNLRLERADAKPLNALDTVEECQELEEICRTVAEILPLLRILKIAPVGGEVNAGQHEFPHPARRETLCLSPHVPRTAGAYVAAEKRDDAVGAVLVATVLHLQESARVPLAPVCRKVLILCCRAHISDRKGRLEFLCEIGVQNADQILFLLIAEHQIYTAVFFQALRRCLRVTARRDDNSPGI